jgi:putative flippase GtrA
MSLKYKIREFVRFGVVGLIATAIHYAIYMVLLNWLSATIAYTIGYITSFFVNFILTNFFTFRTKPDLYKGIGFVISHLINYSLQIILLKIFILTLLGEKYAPIAVFATAVPVNFLILRFVFKNNR